MSVQAMGWVLEHSEATANDRLVLLAIANHASATGHHAFPGYDTMAKEARCSRATAVRAVEALVRRGELAYILNAGLPDRPDLPPERRPNLYWLPKMPGCTPHEPLSHQLVVTADTIDAIKEERRARFTPPPRQGLQNATPEGLQNATPPDGPRRDPRGRVDATPGVAQVLPLGVAQTRPEPSLEPPEEPSVEPPPVRDGPASPTRRQRNPLWDAIVLACWGHADSTLLTKPEQGRVSKAYGELRRLNASPEDVAARADEYAGRWPNVDITPTALVSHWNTLAKPRPGQGARPNHAVSPAAARRKALADEVRARLNGAP